MRPEGNGWKSAALGAVFLLLLGAVGWAWTSTVTRATMMDVRGQDHGERLARHEAELTAIKEWLGRIERKLDRALEPTRLKQR